VHKQFGEANAVLAGDALLNLALLSLARRGTLSHPELRVKLIECLAQATHEVIEGQVLDIAGEGRELSLEEVKRIHWLKTGALLAAACEMGGILADAHPEKLKDLRSFGHTLGVVFQAQDDLLSIQGSSAEHGKTLSSDADKAKPTLPRIAGVEATQQYVRERSERLREKFAALELPEPEPLEQLMREIIDR
jgi:geranylgeranyl pyrophosphate synthase